MSKKRNEYLRTRYFDHLWQAYTHFEGICQKCGEFLELDEAVLHHLKYFPGYMDDPNIRTNEVQLLCRECNKETHYVPCGYCGRLVHGLPVGSIFKAIGIDNGKLVTMDGLRMPVSCVRKVK